MPIRSLSKQLQQKTIYELNENVDKREEDIEHIQKWFKLQRHLPSNPDDQRILNFLRGSKFSLQKTKEKLDMFYTMKSLLPEFYKNRDPFRPEIQEILKLGLFLPLPQEETHPQVILLRLSSEDPSRFKFANVMKVSLMILDILLKEDDNFVISGQIGVIDLSNSSLNHVLHLDLGVCKKAFTCLWYAYPTRPKGFCALNLPLFFNTVANTIKKWLPEKIKKRVFIYNRNNVNDLFEKIPKRLLPKEYGGRAPTIKELTDFWKRKVESYGSWFKEDERCSSDEAKRIGQKISCSEVYDMEGSFRKLNVD